MDPNYSILMCNESLEEYSKKIEQWLHDGIKVIWFGTRDEECSLKSAYPDFVKAFLMQAYTVSIEDKGCILDGKGDMQLFERIANGCRRFNAAQYMVEHCKADENIVVQASAGTGKTSVMIDRILYLIHTLPELHLSEVYMITFTNEAAQQMSGRLQDALMTRYLLTKQTKYLSWLEEQSQMHISTIHSFAFEMLQRFGIGESFTRNLSIRSFDYEKDELIKDAIDEKIDDRKSIRSQLGVPFYRANNLIGDYWSTFTRLGISHQDIKEMDWGQPQDEASENFQNLMKTLIENLDDRFFDMKRQTEAVTLNDIMRDLQEILMSDNLPATDLSMKYLFIDEFQDTDISQIQIACILSKLLGPKLFVVGDVKQSIYRFRGATDKAFQILNRDMKEMGLKQPVKFTLLNNYRTAANVLERMDDYFSVWAKQGYLDYKHRVIPFQDKQGNLRIVPVYNKKEDMDQLAGIVKQELLSLEERIKSSGKEPTEKDRVVLLTRSNDELMLLGKYLKVMKIPAAVRREGAFYASEAVRDFYMMVASFLFSDEPKYIFNYLLTPYAGNIEPMDLHAMERLGGDYDNLVDYLDHFLNETSWKEYHKKLRLRPVMAVFKEMLEKEPVIDSFIANNKARKRADGWEDKQIHAATITNAMQYQANLEKLMEILQNTLGGDKVSLYDVYKFLQVNIATNRSEEESTVDTNEGYGTVQCMTVHKSKGLEFSTVILPYTNESFNYGEATELIIDPATKRVGWNYDGGNGKNKTVKYPPMKNSHYDKLQPMESHSNELEGVRILYVAMTRAIDTLICIVNEAKNPMSWAKLLEEVGVDYE